MSQRIKSLAKGVTLIQLNMEDLRMIEFIVPPIDLQNRYVSLLQQTDKSKYVAYQETIITEKNIKMYIKSQFQEEK